MKQIPYVLAINVCDHAWKDPGTGKLSMLGCFATIASREFPVSHSEMSIVVSITDGLGSMPLEIRVVDTNETRDPVVKMSFDLNFENPLMVGEVVATVANLVFPEPGEYRIQVFANEEFLVERRLLLVKTDTKEVDQ